MTLSERYGVDPLAPPGSRRIILSRGYVALVDEQDYAQVAGRKWSCIDKDGLTYAAAGKARVLMHRMLLGAPEGVCVDHINGNGLDNRRRNIRLCTNAENVRNQRTHRDKRTAKLKGVYRLPSGRYRAQIMVDRKKYNLGNYSSEEAAARAYDVAALKFHGEFARLNFGDAA